MTDNDGITFTRTLIERLLAADGLDPGAAALVEAGLRTGRGSRYSPPDPMQQPEVYYPGLTAKPWHEADDFAWASRLEAAFPEIRREAVALFEAGRYGVNPTTGHLAEGAWQEFRLFSEGHRIEANCRAAPYTAEVMAGIPGASTSGIVCFTHLGPGTHIRAHFGPHNARLRAHLGLVIPNGCRMRVGDRTGGWQEGRLIVFDDSFEHELWHRGDASRLVLLFDVWHPDLSAAQIAAIRYSRLRAVTLAGQIADGWRRGAHTPLLASAAPRSSGHDR